MSVVNEQKKNVGFANTVVHRGRVDRANAITRVDCARTEARPV